MSNEIAITALPLEQRQGPPATPARMPRYPSRPVVTDGVPTRKAYFPTEPAVSAIVRGYLAAPYNTRATNQGGKRL
jgi:hypothetical protein